MEHHKPRREPKKKKMDLLHCIGVAVDPDSYQLTTQVPATSPQTQCMSELSVKLQAKIYNQVSIYTCKKTHTHLLLPMHVSLQLPACPLLVLTPIFTSPPSSIPHHRVKLGPQWHPPQSCIFLPHMLALTSRHNHVPILTFRFLYSCPLFSLQHTLQQEKKK